MDAAIERIVVQATPNEKRAIVAKARRLGLPVSELMRRGATAYAAPEADTDIARLAIEAESAVKRAGVAIDDALKFVEASNRRIAAMEAKARRRR